MSDPKWPEWVCTYQYNGNSWGFSIMAPDEAEASRRLRAIGMTATVDGQIVARIPAYPGAGVLPRIIVGIRNLFSGGTR